MTPARPALLRRLPPALCVLLGAMAPSAVAQDSGFSTPSMPSLPNIPPPPVIPLPVYFPPAPPPVERITKPPPLMRRSPHPASETLTAYSNEIFYSALASRIDQDELKKRHREAIDRYREDKRTLQQELRSELAYILQQPPEARLPLLAAVARRQDPKIAELEVRAETIRDDLNRGDYAWTAVREWKLGQLKRASESATEIGYVMLSAAYFQDGLSTPQRQLLREIAIEISKVADTQADALAAQPYVFFSPSPARVRFPEKIPEAVATKISRYESRKSGLRKELYDAIYREDNAWFETKRELALKNLATRQAPEFAILEDLAEEIRRDLAPMPPPERRKPAVALPPALAQRLIEMFHRVTMEQLRIKQEMGKIQDRYPELRITASFSGGAFVPDVRLVRYSNISAKTTERRKQAEAEITELSKSFQDKLTVLIAERNAMRPEIATAVRSEDPAQINLALAEAYRQSLEQESDGAIDEYAVAVFEPGLSPGQRRILLDAVMEQLDLPLPGGTMQPTRRGGRYGS